MLDLSHLTEEEQEMIMTVLKRDAELKKAEEERIGKLQDVASTGSRPESSLKYLTGEWFYEAKSRRHMDKIHGSEIILASMKQWKSGPLDGSLKLETPKTVSDRGPDSVPPPKPARQLEPTQSPEMSTLDVESDKLNSAVCSPARTRHNPFNRASLILEAPERADEVLTNGNSQVRKSSETDDIAPLKNHTASHASQMSGGSTTSDCSSVGFKPVPKKRTFVSRRSSTPSMQSDSSGPGTQPVPPAILPAPRRSLRCVSNGSSKLPSLEGTGEQSQKSTTTKSNDVASPVQALKSADVISQQPLCDADQVSLRIDLEMDRNTASIATRDRETTNPSDKSYHKPSIKDSSPPGERNNNNKPADRASPDRSDEKDDMTQRETQADSLSNITIQDAEGMKNCKVEAVMRQGDLSFTQSIVDEPICYDLNFIDKPALHTRTKSNPNLLLQTPNPSGEEEDSIAKVLEWFSRSTDSNDWLDKEGGHQVIVNIDRKADISVEDSGTKDMDIYKNRNRDRKREAPEMKRAHREAKDVKDSMEPIKLRATDRIEIQEVTEMHEEARKCSRPQEVKESEDESQAPRISHLKSFWEKGNTGPKILISRSNTNSDKGQKPTLPATEKDREKEVNENQCLNSDMFSAPGLYGGKGKYEKDAFNVKDKQEKELQPPSQQKDKGSIENVQLNITPNQQTEYTAEIHTSPGFLGNDQSPGTHRKDDIKYSTDYMSFPDNTQVVDRRGSDTEIISLTRSSSQPKMQFVSRPESEMFSPLTSSPQPDSLPQARGSPLPIRSSSSITTAQHEDLIDTNLPGRGSPDTEKLYQYRHSPYLDRRGGNETQFTTKMQMQRSSSEDVKRKDNEERSVQSCMSPKKQDDSISKDRSNSPHSQRHGPQRQESTAERIKQLKAFWEKERNKPVNYTGLSKGSGDGKATRCTNLGKLNNRFTKSAYDLRSIGNDSSSDDDDGNRHNFAILTMNQRLDKLSPTIGVNRVQFKNLREFWGEATSNGKGSFDKPKKKDQIDGESLAVGLKQCADPEFYKPAPVQAEKTSTRPAVMKSSSHSQTLKSPHDRQFGSVSGTGNDSKSSLSHYFTTESGQLRDSRRGSKDSTREEKTPKLLSNVGKETRSPKAKRDHLSSRGSSLCRATSMYALNVTEDIEEPFPGQLKKNQEASPVQSQDRRQGTDRTQKRRQSADKGVTSRRTIEDSESLTPRARAFVPRDYRHYLGMTEKTSVHTSLAPAVKEQGLEGKPAYDLDLIGPVRASTPVGSEERYGRRGSKTSPRPLWGNSGSDTGRDSSISSASDGPWSSRNSSNRECDDEDQNPVRRALRRAEARPKNVAKSLEDITASLTPRQERRQDPIVDLRRSSDVPSIPSPSSSSFSDPEHLKKMSKSVPSFLQKEVDGTEPDSTSEDSYHGHRQKTGRSMTNLRNSSGMASSFSLSGSVMTMYSGDYGSVEVQGNIQFSINYVQKLREFHIFVAQCRDLAAVDPKRGRSDPYVKSYLVPDNANLGKRKTSVRKKTQNPTFNEILRYRVRMEYLRTQTLILSVWHHDTFGKNSFLGEVDVDLSKWDFDHTQMNYLALKARPTSSFGPSDDRGEMRLAIRFLPQITHSEGTAKDGSHTGEIHIWVKECKNLPLIRAAIDPYIKCFVLPDTSRKSRQKTRVLRRTVDPIFNHTMVYDGIRQEDLTEACVELTVWDRDRLASNLLGGMRLGLGTGRSYGAVVDWMDSTTYEVALWERMMASPNEWVEDVLPLRMLTPAKTALK